MEISRRIIKLGDLVEGYVDLGNEGAVGYGGRLDIRPPYQREFIYEIDRQQAVIDSVRNNYPLGIMYFVDREDGTYEVLDGQQRILSICKYVNGDFATDINDLEYHFNLTEEEQQQIADYDLDIFVCSGSEREKYNWFERINVAGKPLTKQELLNASHTGPWLTSAKKYFSKEHNAPIDNFNEYMSGTKKRQDWLETVLKWKSHEDYGEINVERYMAEHHKDDNADDLWQYFFRLINWVKSIFTKYRSQMKGVHWGLIYNKHKEQVFTLEPDEVEKEVSELMLHPDIKNKKGIYEYIFDKDERHLNLRGFDEKTKIEKYEEQEGKCAICGEEFAIKDMHADHIIPFSKGGLTEPENCQMLCREDNLRKGNKY